MTNREDAIAELRALLQPGDAIYTILRHVGRSRMVRDISPIVLSPRVIRPGQDLAAHPINPIDLTHIVARALDRSVAYQNHGVRCHGAGMDMGFELVYSLSCALWPNGFECIGDYCPSNDHSNGDHDYSPHHHADGGYGLRQRWL